MAQRSCRICNITSSFAMLVSAGTPQKAVESDLKGGNKLCVILIFAIVEDFYGKVALQSLSDDL